MGLATAAIVVGGAMAVAGTVKAIQGGSAKKKAKRKQAAAEAGLHAAQDALKAVDTSNPFEDATNAYAGLENKMEGLDNVYDQQENKFADMDNKFKGQKNAMEDMENAFEDLTVNTQQAEFEAQQNAQNQANIMSSMAGAAGGSGIAALAQSMANQGAMQAQKASASIGSQEAANQKLSAQADQDIQGKIATEQSRLDTTERSADMDIQKTQMSADDAMQSARLGEESKLQMAEAQEASQLQMAEAQGEMDVQKMKGEGAMWSADAEMNKQKTLMDSKMEESKMAAQEKKDADEKMWGGIGDAISGVGKIFSDERLKENIIKVKYSESGIPIYHFNYKGDNTTWTGTMAQDLLKLGREDAVTEDNGYYKVDYNLIDVNMKKTTPSPLKQLGKNPQEEMTKQKAMTDAGLDIIGGATKRKNWEELQLNIKDIEPPAMKRRKMQDQLLRDKERKMYDSGAQITLAPAYADAGFELVKMYKKELYKALQNDDQEGQGVVKTKLAQLAQNVDVVKNSIQEFYEDHFESESLLSKGVSAQQISFATQMYCKNPDLKVVYAVAEDVASGHTDYYGELVQEEAQYCIVYDFNGDPVMLNVYDGNKDMFIRNNLKAMEYITFLNETHELAVEARESKAATKIDIGRIDYKIDTLFGFNDGTASKEQNELVLMFCHDSEVLRDGSTFRRHLYEHPNIQNLNYGGFDWDKLQFNMPLGPGDKGHWADNIDEVDRLMLVDAIVNTDNEYFNMKLLRTLVKEYYTYKIENAWWKGMGFPEGKIEVMRLKINELTKDRFKKEKAEASRNGQKNFTFDGKVYPTGMTDAKLKKQKADRAAAFDKANPQPNANETK
jgi:hypothetical protein